MSSRLSDPISSQFSPRPVDDLPVARALRTGQPVHDDLHGVVLEDGPARLLAVRHAPPPTEVARERGEHGAWVRLRIGEGRKREVRRLFEAVDTRVERLVRTRLGPLTLAGLREGDWRRLRPREVAALAEGGRR